MDQVYFKIEKKSNTAELCFGDEYERIIDNMTTTRVSVYKRPLKNSLNSSTPSSIKGKQLTSVDYHAYVVLETNTGVYLSLERNTDGIYMGKSPRFGDMVNDTASVELIIEDSSDFSMIWLIEILKIDVGDYNAIDPNCQHFAKFIFDKVADRKQWEFIEPRSFLQKVMAWVVGLFVTSAVIGVAASVAVIVDNQDPAEGTTKKTKGKSKTTKIPQGKSKTTQNPAGGQ